MVATFPCSQYSGTGSVPIGRPINNTRLYVLDPRSLQPLPIGVPGELFASGVGVARGYAGQPQLTAERFLPNPFKQPDDSPSYDRMYRTGDVVAWLPDGNLRWVIEPIRGMLSHEYGNTAELMLACTTIDAHQRVAV
jgi:non-ribosomal peptide synthetase component F